MIKAEPADKGYDSSNLTLPRLLSRDHDIFRVLYGGGDPFISNSFPGLFPSLPYSKGKALGTKLFKAEVMCLVPNPLEVSGEGREKFPSQPRND